MESKKGAVPKSKLKSPERSPKEDKKTKEDVKLEAKTGAVQKTKIKSTECSPKKDNPKQDEEDYSERLRHMCENCAKIIRRMLDHGRFAPLETPKVCPACEHKSIHQGYYNICAICVQLLKECAVCRSPYKTDCVDPLEALWSSAMRELVESLPEEHQREMYQYTFDKWEQYLKSEVMPIMDYKEKCMNKAFCIIGYLENELRQEYEQEPWERDRSSKQITSLRHAEIALRRLRKAEKKVLDDFKRAFMEQHGACYLDDELRQKLTQIERRILDVEGRIAKDKTKIIMEKEEEEREPLIEKESEENLQAILDMSLREYEAEESQKQGTSKKQGTPEKQGAPEKQDTPDNEEQLQNSETSLATVVLPDEDPEEEDEGAVGYFSPKSKK